ncbi:MAG TPA: tRNA guanosine(34) transglycosylase Tgt [Armatimonadota bacterium]|jgi:queuine tRNA-ribosyltransferase
MTYGHFRLLHTSGLARRGEFTTAHGVLQTPAFMPCASHAVIRAVDSADLAATGLTQAICNAFHLSVAPGEGLIARRGGLHRFMDWPGSLATDSGGYQVFSLAEPKAITEQGVKIRSPKTGEWLQLTPERSLQIQNDLGADLIMCFDECAPFPCEHEYARQSLERTLRWAERSRAAHARDDQVLFGIVQGSVYPDLRAQSAQATVALDFPAYSIGGVSVGESRAEMLAAVEVCLEYLPADKLRYVMGVGTPLDIVEGVRRGVDLFDCVLPTRNARHGLLYTWQGPLRLKNTAHREDDRPLDETCPCPACAKYSRAYLSYLLRQNEATAWRLLSLHNLHFYAQLMQRIREAIEAGTLDELRNEVEGWG